MLSFIFFFHTETIQRDFSPVNKRNVYDPWGRAGGGAPIKDLEGQIQTRTAGRVTHDASVSIACPGRWGIPYSLSSKFRPAQLVE